MFWDGIELPPDINESTSLEDVLADDYILQRCRDRNTSLTQYLLKSERIDELIDLITDQANLTFDVDRFKKPSVAAEILSSDIPQLLDFLVSSGSLDESNNIDYYSDDLNGTDITRKPFLDNLLSFIDAPQSLNPLSASFFSKIITNLLSARATKLVPYLMRRVDFLPNLLRHIETSAICDLIIEMMQQDNEQQYVIAQWFLDSDLVGQLIKGMMGSTPSLRYEYSARCLSELISIYRSYISANAPEPSAADGQQSSIAYDITKVLSKLDTDEERRMFEITIKILDRVESEETFDAILDVIVKGSEQSVSTVTNAVEVFLACIDRAKSSNGLPPGAGDEFVDNSLCGLSAGLMGMPMPGRQFLNRMSARSACPILMERSRRTEDAAVLAARKRLPELFCVLKSCVPQSYNILPTTVRILSPPLGKGRVYLINLLSALCQLNCAELNDDICEIGFIPLLMKLFEEYPFNTFIHRAFTDILKNLLQPITSIPPKSLPNSNGENDAKNAVETTNMVKSERIAYHLFHDCNILEWILRLSCIPNNRPKKDVMGDDECIIASVCHLSTVRPKPGYSGHLWQIADFLRTCFPSAANFPQNVCSMDSFLETYSKWEEFVKGDLAVILELHTFEPEETMQETSSPLNFPLDGLDARHSLESIQQILRLSTGGAGPGLPFFAGTDLDNSKLFGCFSFPGGDWGSSMLSRIKSAVRREERNDDDDDEDDILEDDAGDDGMVGNTNNYKAESAVHGDEDDVVNDALEGEDDSSDDEEDLPSPAIIRQLRSVPTVKKTANCLPLDTVADVVPIDSGVSIPWIATGPSQATGLGNTPNAFGGDEGWANFETATFNASDAKPMSNTANASFPCTDGLQKCDSVVSNISLEDGGTMS